MIGKKISSASPMPLAVEVKKLFFRYGSEYVLEDINASIDDGEYIAIIGPNGGGKTTFIKLLCGLLKPTKGEIFLYGKPAHKQQSLIGYLPQNTAFKLDIPLLAKEVILQGKLKAKKFFFNKTDYKALENIAKKLGIEELLNKKIATLSGGQRQKVLLARALIANPKILVLDEPTAAVDLKGQEDIYTLLKELSITRIVVSHDIRILLEGVQRVFYINRKLVVHDNISLPISPTKGHFCEMELIKELKKGCYE